MTVEVPRGLIWGLQVNISKWVNSQYRTRINERQLYIWLPWWLSGKESAFQTRDTGAIPKPERSPGEENGSALQYSGLGNPMDRGVWQATVHGVSKSQTQLSNNNNNCTYRWGIHDWSWIQDIWQIQDLCEFILPVCGLAFCFLNTVFWKAEDFMFMKTDLPKISHHLLPTGLHSVTAHFCAVYVSKTPQSLPTPKSWRFFFLHYLLEILLI